MENVKIKKSKIVVKNKKVATSYEFWDNNQLLYIAYAASIEKAIKEFANYIEEK